MFSKNGKIWCPGLFYCIIWTLSIIKLFDIVDIIDYLGHFLLEIFWHITWTTSAHHRAIIIIIIIITIIIKFVTSAPKVQVKEYLNSVKHKFMWQRLFCYIYIYFYWGKILRDN